MNAAVLQTEAQIDESIKFLEEKKVPTHYWDRLKNWDLVQIYPNIKESKGSAILDLGCNCSMPLVWAHKVNAKFDTLYGVDRDFREQCDKLLGQESGLKTKLSELEMGHVAGDKTIFERNEIVSFLGGCVYNFDIIASLSVIEHMPREDVLKMLELCYKRLNDGGKLLLTFDYWPTKTDDEYFKRVGFFDAREVLYLIDRAKSIGYKVPENVECFEKEPEEKVVTWNGGSYTFGFLCFEK